MAPISAQSNDVADAFSSNFLSNLAPLLTLFGEQVTKQFLSQMTTVDDAVLFALAPTGLLSGVVSAIRLGGSAALRTLVGRARENKAAVEKELLSTTSDSVCEMWSGSGIVRIAGRPMTREFIYRPRSYAGDEVAGPDFDWSGYFHPRVFDLFSLWSCGHYEEVSATTFSPEERYLLAYQAPNLTVNGPHFKPVSWILVPIAVVIQITVLVAACLITFHFKLYKSERLLSPAAAYTTFCIGTVMIFAGLLTCCCVITFAVRRYNVETSDRQLRVARLQKAMRIGDEDFQSYAILSDNNDNSIRLWRAVEGMSEQTRVSRERLTLAGSAITVTGFIAQFVGTLGLHFSVSVTVALASAMMLVLRAWASLGLAAGLTVQAIPEGHELSYLTTRVICDLRSWKLKTRELRYYRKAGSDDPIPIQPGCQPQITVVDALERKGFGAFAGEAIETRILSQKLTSTVTQPIDLGPPPKREDVSGTASWGEWHSFTTLPVPWPDDYVEIARRLNDAVCNICRLAVDQPSNGGYNFRFKRPNFPGDLNFTWENEVHVSPYGDDVLYETEVCIELMQDQKGGLSADVAKISAMLSLWHYDIVSGQEESSKVLPQRYYRLYGVFPSKEQYYVSHRRLYLQWLGNVFEEFTVGSDGLTLEVHQDHPPDLGIARSPVFSLNLYSQDPDFYPEKKASSRDYTYLLSPTDPTLRLPFAVGGLTSSSTPLPILLAQEVLQNFLYCLCAKMKGIQGTTYPAEYNINARLPASDTAVLGGKYRNSTVEAICRCVVEAELVTGLDEARSLVVPIFLNRGLVAVQPVIDEYWEKE